MQLGSRGDGVEWVRRTLARWNDEPVPDDTDPGLFDAALESEVRAFQYALGLEVDGIAGDQTLVHLDGLFADQGPRLTVVGADDVADS
jgi:murein L,D-transpeptidase YcbB/YkuD